MAHSPITTLSAVLRPIGRRFDLRRIATAWSVYKDVGDFWRNGGLTIEVPLDRSPQAGVKLRLLLQPDGDVVLSAPSCFGQAESDAIAARVLLNRGRAGMLRVARTGYDRLSRLASGGFDLLPVAATAIGLLAFDGIDLLHMLGPPLVGLVGGTIVRWGGMKWLVPKISQIARERLGH